MKTHLSKIIFFALWLPLCCTAMKEYTPVTADPLLEPWRWRHEEALDGLGVLCMDEAADGSLWFGNRGSIAHYDGVTVTQIPFDDELLAMIAHRKAIPRAKAIMVRPDGNLLVLIGESLALRSGHQWTVLVKNVGMSVFSADLKLGNDGTIWLVVPGALWRISEDLTELSKVMTAPADGFLGSCCLDAAGNLWVAEKTDPLHARLVRIPVEGGRPKPESTWREYPAPCKSDSKDICIVSGLDGLIWYADNSQETPFSAFDPQRGEWIAPDDSLLPMRLFSLALGRDGTIWAGGEQAILNKPLKEEATLYSSDQLQLPRVPLTMMEADNRRLWVIGRIGYVYSVDIGFSEWMTYQNLHFQCETAEGNQWFREKHRGRAVMYNPRSGKWRQYDLTDDLIDTINVIKSSSHGLIWAAGSHGGGAAFAVFNGKRWERFLHPEFAEWIEPRAVMEGTDGTMWFGAGGAQWTGRSQAGGALQYEVDKQGRVHLIKRYTPRVFPYFVTAFAEAPDHAIWLGSTVVHRFDDSSKRAIPQLELQLGINTVDMTFDQNKTLWVAKEHAGVYRRIGDHWEQFTVKDGLAGVTLSCLLALRDGSLMAASGAGISRFDGKTWTTDACPEWWTMSSRWSGMFEAADDSIWYNFSDKEAQAPQLTINQAEPFYTIRHQAETTPPDTHITDYLDRVAQPGNTHIQWAAHDPWSSTPRNQLQYAWRLDEDEWSAFSPEMSQTFLKLSSGQHSLEVRSRDRAFNIDPTPDRIKFVVTPPIWQQMWFILLISGLVGLIILLIRILILNREKHLMQQQRDREAHLKEIDRMKTGFFTNISHELRTPLTVISGRLETMMKEETDDRRRNTLSIILRNARRLSTLVTQLLDFRKIEEGKLVVNRTHGDLVPFLQDWVASLQVLAEKSDITCTLTRVEECRGQFDFDKLQKIFTNLISNSIKYTQTGGQVLIKFHVEETSPDSRQIQLIVEDTGVGIKAEPLDHIFDRFYRVSETSPAQGSGVGLNLTKELIDLLGGTIRVESPIHPDADRPGTRFTVYLPMGHTNEPQEDAANPPSFCSAQVQSTQHSTESGDPLPSSPRCDVNPDRPLLLVVEDDEDIRDFIIEGLEAACRVETAENGKTGLQKAKELIPDLIVTDVMMPEMDGTLMCRKLKTSIETSHIPVIMLTAKASVQHQLEGLKTGADDYITKPFLMEMLQIRITNLLESRRLLREKFSQEYSALTPAVPENSLEKEFIEKVMAVGEEHYTDSEFKADQFAAALNMSLRSLQRKLKAVTDRTPKEFINQFRMTRAAERLTGSSDTVAEIAFQVGMDEPTNFSRLFKSHFEMTPSQYRVKHQKS